MKTIDEKLAEELKMLTDKIQTKQNQVKLLSDTYVATEKSISTMKPQHAKLIAEHKHLRAEIEALKKTIKQQKEGFAEDESMYKKNNTTLENNKKLLAQQQKIIDENYFAIGNGKSEEFSPKDFKGGSETISKKI